MTSRWKKSSLLMALITLVGLFTFANSLDNSFHYDDEHSILKNPHLRSWRQIPFFFIDPSKFSGLENASMYRPILLCTYALNYAIDGYAVWGYHLVNILLHIANAILVWVLGQRLIPNGYGALVAGLLFVCHPLTTEPVNYISSRSSLLVTLFYLFGIWFYVRIRDIKTRRDTGALVLSYAGALGAKATGITLPLLAWLWPIDSNLPRSRKIYGFLAFVCGVYLWGTWTLANKAFSVPVRSLYSQIATQIKAIIFYHMKTIMPVGLSVEPQFHPASSIAEIPVLLAGAWVLSVIFVGWHLRHIYRIPTYGALWWGITLLPVLLVPLYILVNEHRLYLPLVGWVWGLSYIIFQLRSLPSVTSLTLIGILVVLAVQRNSIWEDGEKLWQDAVTSGPLMPRSHINLSKAYLEGGRYDDAIESAQNALALDAGLAQAHYNLGTAYLHKQRLEEATAYYRRALEIQPGLIEAHINLGNVFQQEGRWQAAAIAYKEALAQQPQAEIFHNLATAYLRGNQIDSAVVIYKKALAWGSNEPETYKGLVKSLYTLGDFTEAREHVLKAQRLWPDTLVFYTMAGDIYAFEGREKEALQAYEKSGFDYNTSQRLLARLALQQEHWSKADILLRNLLKNAPNDIEALCGLGRVLTQGGQFSEALALLREAAHLAPENASVYAQLGQTYLRAQRSLEAQAALEKAIMLRADVGTWWALLAQIYEVTGKTAAAIQAYYKAIALEPALAAPYINLGLLLQSQGDLRQAEESFKAALERAPHSVPAIFNLGTLYLTEERHREAIDLFTRALNLDPTKLETYINMAAAHLTLGEETQALAIYEQALSLPKLEPDTRQQIVTHIHHLQIRLSRQ